MPFLPWDVYGVKTERDSSFQGGAILQEQQTYHLIMLAHKFWMAGPGRWQHMTPQRSSFFPTIRIATTLNPTQPQGQLETVQLGFAFFLALQTVVSERISTGTQFSIYLEGKQLTSFQTVGSATSYPTLNVTKELFDAWETEPLIFVDGTGPLSNRVDISSTNASALHQSMTWDWNLKGPMGKQPILEVLTELVAYIFKQNAPNPIDSVAHPTFVIFSLDGQYSIDIRLTWLVFSVLKW